MRFRTVDFVLSDCEVDPECGVGYANVDLVVRQVAVLGIPDLHRTCQAAAVTFFRCDDCSCDHLMSFKEEVD